ncbi:metallophosphoesterase [uncultured Microbulbifer sp.]|uniref:metallophosphoesterase n=1 Tax=uncultured Microbulbifer sp. TaxID=348147 RepID=UPI00262CBEEC|nr:metallophosphoesterase [uncultured Microbulbifer sp.]
MSVYWTIGQNTEGRDFVVGDVHGYYQQLMTQLDGVDFDPARDRLFCVGDLVDRGPDSAALVDMIDQQVYFSVLGNHEAMMIAGFEDPADIRLHFANGGEWFYELPRSRQQQLAEKVRQWPWAMEIATAEGAIGLVHADVPDSSWLEVKQLLRTIDERWERGASLIDRAVHAVAQPLLWRRGLITRLYQELIGPGESKRAVPEHKQAFLEGLGRLSRIPAERFSPFSVAGIDGVYMGHSYVPSPTTVGNCHFLDTFRGEPGDVLGLVCVSAPAEK